MEASVNNILKKFRFSVQYFLHYQQKKKQSYVEWLEERTIHTAEIKIIPLWGWTDFNHAEEIQKQKMHKVRPNYLRII